MNWTRPADLRAQVQRLWDRGTLLASMVSGEALFPNRLLLKCPTSTEMANHFDDVRVWISDLRAMPHCRLEMREFKHRVFGANAIPSAAWIDRVDDAIALIGKRRDVGRFLALLDETLERQPQLLDWLANRPLDALALVEEWSRLLDIVAWLQAQPRPGIYLRQVDIPGVHSKFIEAHRAVIAALLDIALPVDAINLSASGGSQFAARYGFRDKPHRIRFRLLEPVSGSLRWPPGADITLDAVSFSQLDPKVTRIFITENEINFLAFPLVKDSLVIFGAGYGFEMFRKVEWLQHCRIHYWGDIDTHGFAILDQIRSQFNHVESFLMDRMTLLAFEPQWGKEEKQTLRDLPNLTLDEGKLYDDLRDNRIRKNLRLEQERVGFEWVMAALRIDDNSLRELVVDRGLLLPPASGEGRDGGDATPQAHSGSTPPS